MLMGLRVSIGGLLWVVAFVAVWLASVRSATPVWTAVAATLTLAALLSGGLAAAYRQGEARAFWVGFVLFGGVYLVLVDWDWVGGQLGHDLTAGLSDVGEWLIPDVPSAIIPRVSGLPRGQTPSPTGNLAYWNSVQARTIKVGNFVQIGRMTLSLVFGVIGGVVARQLAMRAGTPTATRDIDANDPPSPR